MTHPSTTRQARAVGVEAIVDWRAKAASALAWWQAAGVDVLVDEAPHDWLARETPRAAVAAAAADPDAMPGDWAAFQRWRGGAATPEAGWPGTAIPAAGPFDAAVMILVDCPDRDDHAAGSLLGGGAAARLFDRMLAAIGLSRESVHLAALCAKRPVAGRIPGDAEERLHAIARHHLTLTAPRRLLVMGNAASRAMLATDVMAARGRRHRLDDKDGGIEVVATFHPRFLLEQPARKAEVWADLRLLVGGLDA